MLKLVEMDVRRSDIHINNKKKYKGLNYNIFLNLTYLTFYI